MTTLRNIRHCSINYGAKVFIDGLQWKKDEKVRFFLQKQIKKKKALYDQRGPICCKYTNKNTKGNHSTLLTLALITYQMSKINTLMY